ncbi:MAG: prolipoprotein diacylglyceryltransferase, partial [Bradymonadia bacterium]
MGIGFNPHLIFETLAYFIAARIYFMARRRNPVLDTDPVKSRWPVVGALVGAALGSRLLSSLIYPEALFDLTGKTIVGAMLGGWIGVELAKKASGIRASTGDVFVPARSIGTAVGRLGCFFSGIEDGTHGKERTLPWAMDLGDGVLRHPAALYEVVVVLALGGSSGACCCRTRVVETASGAICPAICSGDSSRSPARHSRSGSSNSLRSRSRACWEWA